MRTASEYLAAEQAPTSCSTPARAPGIPATTQTQTPRYDDRAIDRLFVRFGSIWGGLWTGRFRNEPATNAAKREWGLRLANCTPADLDRAIAAAIKQYPDAPPSLGQFEQLARPRAACAAHRVLPALPKPKADPERAKSALGRIWAILAGVDQEEHEP